MKINLLALLSLLVGAALPPRLPAAEKPPDRARAAVEKELGQLEADWAAAVESGKPAEIEKFFTEDFLFVGAGGVLQDRKQHLDDFATGKLKVKSVKIKATAIHVYQGAAVVSARVEVEGQYDGRDISGPYQFMDTWVKPDKRWLAAARQQTAVAKPKAEEK